MTLSTEPRPETPRRSDEVLSVVLTTAISALALVYIAVPVIAVLLAWESVAVLYLVLVFTKFKNRTTRGAPVSSRALSGKLLEVSTWALPIAASGTGAASAVALLTTEDTTGAGGVGALLVGLLGSAGVVIAWLLLQTGFAEIYESVHERLPDPDMISFPGMDQHPILSDFLYLSFTVGTSFAISGATVASRKVRRVILLHSVTSFFYNALLIAIAIQVVQGIIARA